MIIPVFSAARTMCAARNWNISNLELQKLLYLAQMTALGRSGGAFDLMGEDFEAWDFGPVLPSVYHRAKAFGDKPVPDVFRIAGFYDGDAAAIINDVAEEFSDFSPSQLVAITHREGGAWANVYTPRVKGMIIGRNEIIEEYTQASN